MKRILALLVFLALALPVWAEVRYLEVSATDTSQTKGVNAAYLAVANDDTTNEIYVRVFHSNEQPSAATTSSIRIKASEAMEFRDVSAISIVCASGETAIVRLIFD